MLGRRLAEQIRDKGYRVVTCGRSPESDIVIDLASGENLHLVSAVEADVLFHCAAAFGGDDYQSAKLNEKVNATACLDIARLAELCGCRQVIYAGSIFCDLAPSEVNLTSYGASKLRGEEILEWALARTNISFCSLRLPQLYDEYGQSFRHQPWFRRIVAYANAGKDLQLPPSPYDQNFLHVVDAATLMVEAAEVELTGVWPATHPVSMTYKSMADLAYQVFGRGGEVNVDDKKTPFKEIFIADSTELFKRLGRLPELSIEEGLQRLKSSCEAKEFGELDVQ